MYDIDTTLAMVQSAKYKYDEYLKIANERLPEKTCPNFDQCKIDIIKDHKDKLSLTDYLNKEHFSHSTMLILARECWEELFINDTKKYSLKDM